jgi:heat-inducible transcriptional repressor
MSNSRQARQLSPRECEILRDLIDIYVRTGEPVSSRAVAKRMRHGLSSASIRTIMADLEEEGFLSQPHASAGRIPTSEGYHLFIEELMRERVLPASERRYIDEHLSASEDADGLTVVASQLLSQLSHQVGIVLIPAMGSTVLKTIEFVPVSGGKVLCVVVSHSGFVVNKIIEIDEPMSREELVRISNYVTDNFAGLTLSQIRDRLLGLLDDARAQVDRLVSRAISLAQRGLEMSPGPAVVVDGTESLLSQPELADLLRVRRMFETFADKARLVKILNLCMEGPGVQVLIGSDSDVTSELDFSLVATRYGIGDRAVGTLGIFGPSRMEYPRVIPLVDYLGETVSETLARRL